MVNVDERLRSVGWQQKCQISAVRHKLPCSWEEEENSQSFSRGQIWHKVLCCCSLQDIGYSWATQSGCAPHIPDQGSQPGACTCYRETGMNIRKTTVWKNGLTSSQKDQLKPKQKHPCQCHSSCQHNQSHPSEESNNNAVLGEG